MANLSSLLFNKRTARGWVILGFTGAILTIAHYANKHAIKDVCRDVGYCCPENVQSFYSHDFNKDGKNDITLNLKDGSELHFVRYEGYNLERSF